MAWNEPGDSSNNNPKDPWIDPKNKKPSNDIVKNIQQYIYRLFKKNSPNIGNYSYKYNKNIHFSLFYIIGIILLIIWLYNAIYIVDEQEQAVIFRLGKYYETVGPGLNFNFPLIDKRFKENVTRERAYSKQGQMLLTKDENIVEVPLTVQYKISNLKKFIINVYHPEITLKNATESVLRHVAGSTSMDNILTDGREKMSIEVHNRLQKYLNNYKTGITLTQVNIQSAQAPSEVQEAFDDVIRAREDEQREINKAEAYANSIIPEARGQSKRIIEEANGYRSEVISRAKGDVSRFNQLLFEYQKYPEVTRKRLYIDTMQSILTKTTKILISNTNNVMYFPLDKIISNTKEPQITAAPDTQGIKDGQ